MYCEIFPILQKFCHKSALSNTNITLITVKRTDFIDFCASDILGLNLRHFKKPTYNKHVAIKEYNIIFHTNSHNRGKAVQSMRETGKLQLNTLPAPNHCCKWI
jgi:hypothetical protein